MTDLVQIIIQIQKTQPEINNLKGLAKFVYDNLNPRNVGADWPFPSNCYGVNGSEIVDFLMMYGLDQKTSEKILQHMDTQALLRRNHTSSKTVNNNVYVLNFKD